MNAASSTTSTRAISCFLLGFGSAWFPGGSDLLDSHRPLVVDQQQPPAGEAAAVDKQLDGLVRRAVEVDDCAGRKRPPGRPASGCGPARPTRARGSPHRLAGDAVAALAVGAAPASRRARSASARVIRTTNAFGTSCTSRQGSPSTVKPTLVMCGARSKRVVRLVRRREELRLRRADLDLLAEHGAVAAAAAAIIWFIASPAADSSSSDSSSPSSTESASMPIIAAASRCTPRRVITKMLPPVTPSTYETLAATAGTGIDRSGASPAGRRRPCRARPRRGENCEHARRWPRRSTRPSLIECLFGGHRSPPPPVPITCDRAPVAVAARPGAVGRDVPGVERHAARRRRRRSGATSPGLSASTSLDRQLRGRDLGAHLDVDGAERRCARRLRPSPGRPSPRRTGCPRGRRARPRSSGTGGAATSSRTRRRSSPRSSASSVGSLGGASWTAAICDSSSSRSSVDADQLLPRHRQLLEQACEDPPGQRHLDLGQLARAGLAGAAAPPMQPLDQPQHERQLGAHQDLGAQRPCTRRSRRSTAAGTWAIAVDHVSWSTPSTSSSISVSSSADRRWSTRCGRRPRARARAGAAAPARTCSGARSRCRARAGRGACGVGVARPAVWPCFAASTSAAICIVGEDVVAHAALAICVEPAPGSDRRSPRRRPPCR